MNLRRSRQNAIKIKILSKPDCHLCDVAKAVLLDVQKTISFAIEEIDITEDRALFEEFKEKIPVIFINGRKAFKYRVEPDALRRRLARIEARYKK